MSKSESGAQLLARLGSRPSLDEIERSLFPTGLASSSVVELFGTEGGGKTELLLHFVAKCILPSKWQTFELEGLNSKVVFIDTDYKFSILRLVILLEKRITDLVSSQAKNEGIPNSDEIEGFITKCLKNLSLLRCSSSQQLLCSLHSLENTISADPGICCVMVDSISAFYWIDRCNYGDSGTGHEKNFNKVVDILEMLSTKYHVVVFATKAAIFKGKVKEQGKGDNSSPFVEAPSTGDTKNFTHVEYLGKRWNTFVSERLILKNEVSEGENSFTAYQKSSGQTTKFIVSESGVHFV